jgi:anti-sigma-K factor RskA
MAARAPAIDQDTAGQQSGKPILEPGEWMNHLIPPEASAPTYSFGWVIGLAVAVILAGGGYLAWTAYDARMSEDTTRLAQLQEQAATAGAKLAALQRQIDERDKSLATTREELDRRILDLAELKDQLIQREAELEVATAQLTQQGGQPARTPQDELAALLRMPNTKGIVLAGTETAKQASGIFLYDARIHKAWFYALHLPECPNGMTYQLWAMRDQPVSVATFRVGGGETSHMFAMPIPGSLSAQTFSVSLEPIGGRPQPTGPIYLLSRP